MKILVNVEDVICVMKDTNINLMDIYSSENQPEDLTENENKSDIMKGIKKEEVKYFVRGMKTLKSNKKSAAWSKDNILKVFWLYSREKTNTRMKLKMNSIVYGF